MKHKVGDKVKVKSIEWYNENKKEDNSVNLSGNGDGYNFIEPMSEYCGRIVTICDVDNADKCYDIVEDDGEYFWTDEMFEDVMEKKTPKTQEEVNNYLLANSVRSPANLLDIEQTLQNDGLKLPEDVRVNSSGISGIAFIKWYETEQYPKTYFDCCKELGFTVGMSPRAYGYKSEEISALQKLIVCRNAYWKIAGGWTLDYDADELYFICNERGHIVKAKGITDYNTILAFPTEEMRDEFYENFKDLIEHCKEFL